MSYAQTGPVVVMTPAASESFPWATSVRVDRAGALHIYGHHKQHAVFLEGEWSKYGVSAPTRAEVLGNEAV
jgi:hypothetical protein